MKTPILIKKEADITQFIEYWSSFYSNEKNESKYTENINKPSLNAMDLLALYEWKNGSVLSVMKKRGFDNNIGSKIKTINLLKKEFVLDSFDKEFGGVSEIWKIFLLHIISPSKYPIFDQHVFRAMKYLEAGIIEEIHVVNKEKKNIYRTKYLPFFEKIRSGLPQSIGNKKIDEALWVFGKFIKSDYKKTLD